ncbi:MAG: caspase family protein [Anaerolineae bacterium]
MSVMDNAHTLVVGIANYRRVNQLSQAVLEDAQDVYDLLIAPRYCGYPPDNAQLLLNEQATKATLRRALTALAERSGPLSTVLFYFSGHGCRIESGAYAGEYLLPVDADYTSGASFARTTISGPQLTKALRAISARKVTVVLDCCHVSGIGQPKEITGLVLKPGFSESYYDVLQVKRGQVILASSRSTEFSHTMPQATNSLFAHHLLAGLRGGVPGEDGLIRIFDLFEYLQPRVTGDQPNQHPILKAKWEGNFPIALYRGGQKGSVPKDEWGFRHDVYVSYTHKESDARWVWKVLIPYLRENGLRVAVPGAVEVPDVARVVDLERAIEQSRRIVVVLSKAYLTDNWGDLEDVIAHTMGIRERKARVFPVLIEPMDKSRLHPGLELFILDFAAHHDLDEYNLDRLVEILQMDAYRPR